MLISTKGRYALQVMCDLLAHDSGDYVPLKEIAARQSISQKYLESITKTLVRGGLVEASSGRGGGYRLLRSGDDYTVGKSSGAPRGRWLPLPAWRITPAPVGVPVWRAPFGRGCKTPSTGILTVSH